MSPTMASTTGPPVLRFIQGTRPLLISMPHVGTHVPPELAARFTDEARQLRDTDWHLERLYEHIAADLGASLLIATHSRYVIDLNRPPDDRNLYPGRDTTGLCPTDTFDRTPLYTAGVLLDEHEIAVRRDTFWQPYHRALRAELDRLRRQHDRVALWDAHSIRSVVPRLFDGKLPDLNLGTADGVSCDAWMESTLAQIVATAPGFTGVLNGRFKGGYITRHYGDPVGGIHAVQLEMAQSTYMEEELPFEYIVNKAATIQPHLRRMLDAVLAFIE